MVTQLPVGRIRASSNPCALKASASVTFAAALFAGQIATAQEEIWIGSPYSPWSIDGNWLDGTAPPIGGSAALTLEFRSSGTSFPDLGSFALNRMVFDSTSTGSMAIFSSNRLTDLHFAGADPRILIQGVGDVSITSRIEQDSADGGLTISGTGSGNLVINGEIVAPNALTIDRTSSSAYLPEVRLTKRSTISGGVILKSGNLAIVSSAAVGDQPLQAYGGLITLTGEDVALANPIVLHGNVALRAGSNSNKYSGVISSAEPGSGIVVQSFVTLTGASTYTGATTLAGGTLYLDGPDGSVLNTSQFNVNSGLLWLLARNPNDDRIGDATPIHLRSGHLRYRESDEGDPIRIESVGPVDGVGSSLIEVDLKGASNAGLQLHLASLTRNERGVFTFQSENLGRAPAVGVGNIFIGSPLPSLVGGGGASSKTSIIPYALGYDLVGALRYGFVTYSPLTGVRVLNSADDYQSSIVTAAPDENVFLKEVTEKVEAPRVVNALYLYDGSVSGLGKLVIASGALLSLGRGPFNRISNPLDFGSTEAILFAHNSLILDGPVSGTNGLTLAGGTLTLNAHNTFTGPLTINAGSIRFSDPNQLGLDNSAIVFNGGGLIYAGSGPMNFSRPIETRGAASILSQSSLVITAPITGAGTLTLGGADGSLISLPSGSTYTGATYVTSGTIEIHDDSNLGAGGALNLRGGTLVLANDWSSNREINASNGAVDTHGFDAVWNGPLTSIGAGTVLGYFTKLGAGELRLTSQSSYRGRIIIDAGTFTLANAGQLAAQITVNSGSTLNILHDHSDGRSKLGDNSSVYFNGGAMVLTGNDMVEVTETVGQLVPPAHGRSDQRLYLVTPGVARVRLVVRYNISPGSGLLIGASSLGVQQRVVLGDPSRLGEGIIPNVYAGSMGATVADSFVIYDSTTDNGGVIGVRPLKPAEYTNSAIVQNPANGGLTPVNANYLADGPVTATGDVNSINNLTVNAGSSVWLASSQILKVDGGQILARSGGATISGGTLAFGSTPLSVYNSDELTIGSVISGSGGLRKLGPGKLVLANPVGYAGPTEVSDGVLQPSGNGIFTSGLVDVYQPGIFNIGPRSIETGTLSGTGTVSLDGGSLTFGVAGDDFIYSGRFTGTGQLIIEAGGNPNANRVFSGVSDFTGRVSLNSGIVNLWTKNALGSGDITSASGTTLILGGSLSGALDVSGHLETQSGTSEVTVGGLLFRPNSSLGFSLYATARIASIQTPVLAGPITLVIDTPSGGRLPSDGDQFVLIENRSGLPLGMTSDSPLTYAGNSLSEGERFFAAGQEWQLSYQGGSGNNDVVLYAVPEPVTGVGIVAGLALLGLRRRRALPQH